MQIEFIVGAQSVVLTNYGRLVDGRRGDLAPATVLETELLAGLSVMSAYRQEKRPLDLPFLFKAAAETTLLANIRTMLDVLTAGEGVLKVTRNDAVVRQLQRCYYKDGLREKGWLQAIETVLSFDSLDPYWYDPTPTSEVFTVSLTSLTTFFPFFPLVLTASSIIERKNVTNPGAPVWPVWTIVGPGENPTITNHTTGESITLVKTLIAGDVLVIDTSPLAKTVILNGANAYQYLTAASTLFSLAHGVNDLSVQMNLFVAGTSTGTLQFYPRYVSL